MPNWNSLLDEARAVGCNWDVVRRKYLNKLHSLTKRNIIIYYSGWLQKRGQTAPGFNGFSVNDSDKNGFMSAIHQLDRTKGLDLILHTPGGEIAACESLVDYLRAMFGTDIRAIVPQLALSAGTMMACACKEIVMGTHSSLGPIDPQFGGLPAHALLEEYQFAVGEIQRNGASIPLWQQIFSRYSPTTLGECQKAIDWSNEMVKEWLVTGMFKDDQDAEAKATKAVTDLGDHALTKTHSRHLSAAQSKAYGLNIIRLENDQKLQDAVLTVHHACIQTLSETSTYKMIENHKGVGFFQSFGQPSQ